MKVATVLVNWCQPDKTIACAKALIQQSQSTKIIIVDNGSHDDSFSKIKMALPNHILLSRRENGGFGAGCNLGIDYAISIGVDYIWLINNDAIPAVDCLEQMLKKATTDSAIGAVGACMRDPNNLIKDHAGCILHSLTLQCQSTMSDFMMKNSSYAWITGASILLSTKALLQIGNFDEAYFMYWEDADLCQRLRLNGFQLAIAPYAIVLHSAGTSSHHIKIQRFEWHLNSQIRWIKKYSKFKFYSISILYLRIILKSIITINFKRIFMLFKNYK